jgi:hypothetical protein
MQYPINQSFSWHANYRPKADAQKVGEELERLRQRDGTITVDVALDEARSTDSPLHALCTWEDGIAAENWRRDEIRRAIRSIKVITPDLANYRAFVHCANSDPSTQGYYQRVEVAVQNLDEYELVFKAAASRLGEAQRALSELKRVAESVKVHQTVRRAAVEKADKALAKAGAELAKAA